MNNMTDKNKVIIKRDMLFFVCFTVVLKVNVSLHYMS